MILNYTITLYKISNKLSKNSFARIHRNFNTLIKYHQFNGLYGLRNEFQNSEQSKKNRNTITLKIPFSLYSSSSSTSSATTKNSNGEYRVFKQVPKTITIPKVYPIVPVIATTKTPIFPRFAKTLEIKNPMLVKLIRQKVQINEPYAGIFLRKQDENETDIIQHLDEIYRVGSFVHIQEMHDFGDKMKLLVNAHRRIIIKKQIYDNVDANFITDDFASSLQLEPVIMAEIYNLKHKKFQHIPEVKAITREIFKTIRDIITINPLYSEILQLYLKQDQYMIHDNDTVYLGDLGAALTSANSMELQEIMEELDIPTRLMLVLSALKKEIELSKLQVKIAAEVEDTIKKVHRKFMLTEQIKVLKKELGVEKEDKDNIIDKYRKRFRNKIIPIKVSEVVEEEINKMNMIESNNSEFNVIRNYLDWLTILPWGTVTQEQLDIKKATEILDTDHYGMIDVKRRILEFIAVSKLKGSTQGKILCFHGPPGVGKTSIAKSIAQSLNRKYFRFSVGGLANVSEIKGHRRTYVGAMPGKLIQCLKVVQSENPLILIDEIDKIGKGEQGTDPSSALLELLDPEQNTNFLDYYIDVPLDLSKVLFICTANVLDTIPIALRDRMELIEMSGYVAEEKMAIARQYLIPKLLLNNGLNNSKIEITDTALYELINNYCRESGVRSLEQHIDKIIRKIAVQFVQNETEYVEVTDKNISQFLGNPDFTIDNMYKKTPAGVAVGLGWTTLGGQTIYIETAKREQHQTTNKYNNSYSKHLELTGQLGQVMKESAEIALTVARKFMKFADVENKYLETNKIHIHVPKGSIPKDGPSAGVTIVSALMSLALNKPLKQNMAMTGELSLGGKILPVGGIKEKVIAAKRNGVKYLILPEDNRKEYLELSSYITDGLEVHFVDDYEDVFKVVFQNDS